LARVISPPAAESVSPEDRRRHHRNEKSLGHDLSSEPFPVLELITDPHIQLVAVAE
jgi:hypothetical protein